MQILFFVKILIATILTLSLTIQSFALSNHQTPISLDEKLILEDMAKEQLEEIYPDLKEYTAEQKLAVFLQVMHQERNFIKQYVSVQFNQDRIDEIRFKGSPLTASERIKFLQMTNHIYETVASQLHKGITRSVFENEVSQEAVFKAGVVNLSSVQKSTITAGVIFVSIILMTDAFSASFNSTGTVLFVLSGLKLIWDGYIANKAHKEYLKTRDSFISQQILNTYNRAYELDYLAKQSLIRCGNNLKNIQLTTTY